MLYPWSADREQLCTRVQPTEPYEGDTIYTDGLTLHTCKMFFQGQKEELFGSSPMHANFVVFDVLLSARRSWC